jgi:hypothetical protein
VEESSRDGGSRRGVGRSTLENEISKHEIRNSYKDVLPHSAEMIRDAGYAWSSRVSSVNNLTSLFRTLSEHLAINIQGLRLLVENSSIPIGFPATS